MATGATAPAIQAEGVGKSFGAVQALTSVNLHLRPGEILGLIGDNGAGKSTFIKILTGFLHQDTGRILVNGEEVRLRSVDHARSLGIETVYQDLALVNEINVYHNLFLNREPLLTPLPFLHNRQMRRLAWEHLAEMGVDVPSVDAPVAQL